MSVVSSLFTNIPLDEAIDLCTDLVFHDNDKLQYRDCALDCSLFRKLLGCAVKENYGIAIGYPLGPSLANIFMSELEQRFSIKLPS